MPRSDTGTRHRAGRCSRSAPGSSRPPGRRSRRVSWRWKPLAEPQQRRPAAVSVRRPLRRPARRNAGLPLGPPRGAAGGIPRQHLLVPDRSLGDEGASKSPSRAARGATPKASARVGAREGLYVHVGRLGGRASRSGSTTTVGPGRLGQPMLVLVRRRRRRVRPPDEDRTRRRARSAGRSLRGRPVQVLQRDVPGLVADRVGVHFRRADAVEEPQAGSGSRSIAKVPV